MLLLIAQQVVIGLSLGFAVRVVFAAVEFAGEIIGLQMGLNFAGFFDPLSATTATATSRFFGTMVAWLFIVMNGHLLVIGALMHSFTAFPVGPEPFAFLREMQPQKWGAEIFSTGLWIALPLVTMLLFINLVLGTISRVAPQINIFAIGFPVTLGVGLIGLVMTLPLMQQPVHDGTGQAAAALPVGRRRGGRSGTNARSVRIAGCYRRQLIFLSSSRVDRNIISIT